MASFDLQQRQTQQQTQILSQKQIQSLEFLSLGSEDLRAAIYKAVDENPALVIKNDSLAQGLDVRKISKGPVDYTRVSSSTSQAAREASDNFQAALEAKFDDRQSLKEHLLSQLHILHLSKAMINLGDKLIHNLDDKGFHILAPISLLDSTDSNQNETLLEKCLSLIQNMDPVGTCVKGTEESLYVQAKAKPNCPPLVLFLLDGHFEFLNPPQPLKIIKKINNYLTDKSMMFALTSKEAAYQKLIVNEKTVTEAISFIRTLDPFPASDFGISTTTYISPDVYVDRVPGHAEFDDYQRGIVIDLYNTWAIRLSGNSVPSVELSPQFTTLISKEKLSVNDQKVVNSSIKKASEFIETLKFREYTIQKACCEIVKKQHVFFDKGPGNLIPLRQKDIAEAIGVHETTISRMANSKYIQCEWGLFAINYFFTNAVNRDNNISKLKQLQDNNLTNILNLQSTSKDNAMFEIKKILEEHQNDSKKLSDQKLCNILLERGIKIARRTIAKYRAELNINSSYSR